MASAAHMKLHHLVTGLENGDDKSSEHLGLSASNGSLLEAQVSAVCGRAWRKEEFERPLNGLTEHGSCIIIGALGDVLTAGLPCNANDSSGLFHAYFSREQLPRAVKMTCRNLKVGINVAKLWIKFQGTLSFSY